MLPMPGGDLEMFLPHETFQIFVEQEGSENVCLSADELGADFGLGPLLRDWSSAADVGYLGDLAKVAVLGIHCDGVSYTTTLRAGGGKGVLAASLNVVSARDERVRHKRLPIFVISKGRLCKCGCGGYCTLNAAFGVVAWSFRCMLSGRAPSTRHDGSQFTLHDAAARMEPGRHLHAGALLQLRGDWEYVSLAFRLRHTSNDGFCWLCEATKADGPMCFKNFADDAPYKATKITHERYLEACLIEGATPSLIFTAPGTELRHIAIDTMHTADLGTFQDCIGSLFWIECTTRQWYGSKEEGLRQLNLDLDAFYSANRDRGLSRVTPLTWQQIRAKVPGYPYLKAKASQTRHLAEYAVLLSQQHAHGLGQRDAFRFKDSSRLAGRSDEHNAHLVAMCEGMAAYQQSCTASPFRPDECAAAVKKFLTNFSALHDLWRAGIPEADRKLQPFHLRQKTHLLTHLAEDQLKLFGSPARSWCYRDEDYVGVIKVVAGLWLMG
jgi:hypothetical protein